MEKIRILLYPSPDGVCGRVCVYPEKKFDEFLDRSRNDLVDFRFEQSLWRTKSIARELSICNDWDYFCTFTFDSNKVDRYCYKDVSAALQKFFTSYRKNYTKSFRYMVVPECHVDGAIHFHGLVKGIRPEDLFVPDKVLKRVNDDDYESPFDTRLIMVPNTKGYLRWKQYKLGFMDLSPVRDHFRCSSYVLKYITKSMQRNDFIGKGDHIVLHSQGLRRSIEFVKSDIDYAVMYDICKSFMGEPLAFQFCDVYQNVPYSQIEEAMKYLNVPVADIGG